MGYSEQVNRIWTWGVPKKVTKAAVALPQTTTDDLFTISGGRIALLFIVGQVTTQIGNVANDTQLQYNPTLGVIWDLCAVLNIQARDTNTLFGTRMQGQPMRGIDNAGLLECPDETEWGTGPGLLLQPGVIILNCGGDDGGGGRIVWSLWYIPQESGAYVTAV